MRLKVLRYVKPLDHYVCEKEDGRTVYVDLHTDSVSPGHPEGIWTPEKLVGKTISVESLSPYEYIAIGVRIEEG